MKHKITSWKQGILSVIDRKRHIDSVESLIDKIQKTLEQHIIQNQDTLRNWHTQSYDVRKQYVKQTLELLLNTFPDHRIKPKILFAYEHNIKYETIKACFFSKNLTPQYSQIMLEVLGTDEPMFIFFNDLSERGITGQIVHEFTHYLQATRQSSISSKEINKELQNYKLANEDKEANYNHIFEIEARLIDKKISEFVAEKLNENKQKNMTININTR